MKTLYLLRHAKSSWAEPALADFDRPLGKRGRKAAPRMATYMREHGLLPELALCSAAVRTQQTWELVAEVLGDIPVKTYRSLYLASPARLLETLRRQPDELGSVIMIAHNPGMGRLAIRLSGPGSDPAALTEAEAKFPTAALAEIGFDVESWSQVGPGGGRMIRCIKPRQLEPLE